MKACIPYGAYWSSPFCRWQGSLANTHAFELAKITARAAIARRKIDLGTLEMGVLGTTVPQKGSFYGLPWLTGELGAPHLTGPTIAQACATGVRVLATAAHEVEHGVAAVLTITTDRISNGPQLYYPDPQGPGGSGTTENWVLDNFACDPWGGVAMIDTAENVATKYGIATAEQHDLVLARYQQYDSARADDGAFHKRFMEAPLEISVGRGVQVVMGDEGIQATTADRIAKLKPVRAGGTVTHASQTHPADGTAGIIITDAARARDFATDASISVEIVSFGQARVDKAMMPEAPVPAAKHALERAGLSIADMAAIKTHNPFVLNDIVFARAFAIDAAKSMNNFGCSLVWGHPQAPTGTRSIIELIEELALRGGGYGLFAGCAAGDTAMAMIVKVSGAG
jgi:acetyl-CoA acyltransferase